MRCSSYGFARVAVKIAVKPLKQTTIEAWKHHSWGDSVPKKSGAPNRTRTCAPGLGNRKNRHVTLNHSTKTVCKGTVKSVQIRTGCCQNCCQKHSRAASHSIHSSHPPRKCLCRVCVEPILFILSIQ